MAVVFAVGAMLVYIGALMCSHIAAFRVQANIRKDAMHHIASFRSDLWTVSEAAK